MSGNTTALQKHMQAIRRERVAQFKLRGFSIREIVERLSKEEIIIEETGEKITLTASVKTVHKDIKAMEKIWQENAVKDISIHKANQLAELAQVKHSAWTTAQLKYVIEALKQEAKLLGTEEPIITETRFKVAEEAKKELSSFLLPDDQNPTE